MVEILLTNQKSTSGNKMDSYTHKYIYIYYVRVYMYISMYRYTHIFSQSRIGQTKI